MTFALAEHLVFSPVGDDRARTVARRIRQAMAVGVLAEGQPLPSEADMASRLGVSTTTLRAALADLRQEGWLETRRGRGGGSFVRPEAVSPELWNLMGLEPEEIRDLGDHHATVAGGVAALAAERAMGPVMDRLEGHATSIAGTRDWVSRIRADSRFHIEVAAATRSAHLAASELSAQSELTPLIWTNSSNSQDSCLTAAAEHRAIVSAIRARDAETARLLAECHVTTGIDYLIQLRLDAQLGETGASNRETAEDADAAQKSLTHAVGREAEAWEAALDQLTAAVRADLDERPYMLDRMVRTEALTGRLLGDSSHGLFGAGFICAPEAFGGRLGHIWTHRSLDGDGIRELEPDMDYFDSATTTWWQECVKRPETYTSGPYVDATGTNQYVITIGRRVDVSGRFVGVAALDVTVRHIQRQLQRYVAPLPPGSCLADQEGAVLVTSTGRLLGRRLSRADGVVAAPEVRPTGWKLVLGSGRRLLRPSGPVA